MLTLEEIVELEMHDRLPEAIEALETRLRENRETEPEAVLRLGFLLWYVFIEHQDYEGAPWPQYGPRFVELLRRYKESLWDNADFCWAFGQGVDMFWFMLDGTTEQEGKALIARACELDAIYARFWSGATNEELIGKFRGRGFREVYYGWGRRG